MFWRERREPDGNGDSSGESEREGDHHRDGERWGGECERYVRLDGQSGERCAENLGHFEPDNLHECVHGAGELYRGRLGDASGESGSERKFEQHTLVPNGNIVFGGSGANRTVTVTPAAGQLGTATITVTVSDGQLTANDTFVLTVISNTPPTIGPIVNQTAYVDQPVIIKLELSDAETPVTDLQLSLITDNPILVKPEDYEFHYFIFDNHRYLTMAGAFGQTGNANVSVTVSDGQFSAIASFGLTVLPPPPSAARFENISPITIPNLGPASLYPSDINVSGMSGVITKLELTVSRFSHEYPGDINMLLVGPTGVGVVFLSNAGGGRSDQCHFHRE